MTSIQSKVSDNRKVDESLQVNHQVVAVTATPQLSPVSSSASTSSPILNKSSVKEAQDVEGIALLRQIFPGESIQELRRVHEENVRRAADLVQSQQPTSKLGRRIWKEFLQAGESNDDGCDKEKTHQPLQWRAMELPDNFLRLPPEIALRRFDDESGCWEYEAVKDLEKKVLNQQEAHYIQIMGSHDAARELFVRNKCFSPVLFRDPKIGLGITLAKDGELIRVHAVISNDGRRWECKPPKDAKGPSVEAGILPGDVLLGLNGISIHQTEGDDLLKFAVSIIRQSPDPIVFHFIRIPSHSRFPEAEQNVVAESSPLPTVTTPSLLDTTWDNQDDSYSKETSTEYLSFPSAGDVHPFARVLASRGLVRTLDDQLVISRSLAQFTDRTRQWESTGSFRIDSVNFSLRPHFDPKDLPPPMVNAVLPFEHANAKSLHSFAPSTPTLPFDSPLIPDNVFDSTNGSLHSEDEQFKFLRYGPPKTPPKRFSYPGNRPRKRERNFRKQHDLNEADIFIPLMGVRKALSVRILNTFLEDNRTAYTIWVYDVQSGREWYAPIRYFQDFQDLRTTTAPLSPLIAQIPFPATGWHVFAPKEATESTSARAGKCRQLEHFLRTLCALVYRGRLHPDVAEVAIHVQSFLGCEAGLGSDTDLRLHSQVAMNEIVYGQNSESGHDEHQMSVRLLLKRSIQRYTYRLFLLETMEAIIDQFVNLFRAKGPALRDIESLEAQGRTALKERALKELEKIRGFLDQMQELVLEGCKNDFLSISKRRDFVAIRKFMEGEKGLAYWERLVREAVREQIEIEVYVPLRSVVSRLLVNGWRHDDMEVQFKMQELRKRPQKLFRIPAPQASPSNWQSVSNILSEGVGLSTLPCAKLRAIVDAAREVTRLYAKEHPIHNSVGGEHLGADDFLPIFIFCVVQAEMERPCALCVLLKTLCDRVSRIGEIGYYLASFEAAIMHIQEIDLTDDRDEMKSFMSIPLTDVSQENHIGYDNDSCTSQQ